MPFTLLGDVLKGWQIYELDDSIYVAAGTEPSLDIRVNVLPFDRLRQRVFENQHYLLGIEQVRDAVESLERQLGRAATATERLRAVVHYARHDAFIDPQDVVGGQRRSTSLNDLNGPMSSVQTDALLRALDACKGGSARVVAVTESHAMLVLRVTPERAEPVTLLCGECKRIETSVRWQVVQLQYDVVSTDPYRYRIFDAVAGFSVGCGVIRVAEHPDEWKAVDGPA